MDIRIIRLQSGDDLIADYEEKEGDGMIYLRNPMTLFFKRLPTGKAMMLMAPWLPIELVENNGTWLYAQDILTVMQPKASLINYYNKSVDDMSLEMFTNGNDVDEALQEFGDSEVDTEPFNMESILSELQEEPVDEEQDRIELEELRKDIKKRLLH